MSDSVPHSNLQSTTSSRWKTIPIFISSTFRDMHAERDQLDRVVFPALVLPRESGQHLARHFRSQGRSSSTRG